MQDIANRETISQGGWTPPETFDGYRKLSILGKGGMGEVYLCHDSVLDRPVAIKFISGMEPGSEIREQFLNEARATARLQHPNVVTVYRVGEIDGHPYIVAEYIRGENLARLKKPLPWQDVLELGLGLSRGLAAAHRRGILHRDIKPSNAILSLEGEVKLVDFGLAKLMSQPLSLNDSTEIEIPEDSEESSEPTVDVDPGTPSQRSEATEGAVTVRQDVDSDRSNSKSQGPQSSSRNIAIRLGLTPPQPRTGEGSEVLPTVENVDFSSGIRGTPRYMAPETLSGNPASRRSDVYSLGALLYELCVGTPPHARVPLEALAVIVQQVDAPAVRSRRPSVDERFAAIVDRCLSRNPADRFASAEDLLEALDQLTHKSSAAAIPEGNPYRGLLPFEAEHRSLFFGRQQEIGTLLDWLRSDSFVLIVADSGAGKSSLCRAGVLPLVSEGGLGGGRNWLGVSMVPGRHPLQALCAALAQTLKHADFTEERIALRIRTDAAAFGRTLQNHLGADRGLILFVDQLEELVSIADPTQSTQVSEALAGMVQRMPGLRLLATVRSDFLARCATLSGLGGELTRPLFFLKPLNEEGIREAIVGPARLKGVTFQREETVESLVNFTVRTDGALPLLQFALAELWTVRQEAEITPRALESIGGVEGALARHGDNLLGTLQPAQRKAARRLLMSLVTLEGTRNRRTLEELTQNDPAAAPALEALVKGRLLVGRESPDGALYEVAHEALIKGWRTLSKWLEEAAESRAVKHRLEIATNDWNRLNKSRDALWNLQQVAETNILEAVEISPREKEFLATSRRFGLRARRIRRIVAVTAPLLIVALFVGAKLNARRDIVLRTEAHIKEGTEFLQKAELLDTQAQRLRHDAFAAFDEGKDKDGEVIWKKVLDSDRATELAYTQAAQSFESATNLDGSNQGARTFLSNTLYQRALVLERGRKFAQAEELISRLSLYDPKGEYSHKWRAPGKLQIHSNPGGAEVKLSKFSLNEKEKYELIFIKTLGHTPLAEVTLEPGSYLLELDAPGRAHVKYPVLINRGETLPLQIDMPKPEEIPAGFAYVPGGRYMLGSAAGEDFRKGFLINVPVHSAYIGNFLMAVHEATNGEWLQFIKDVPPGERSKYDVPRIDGKPGSAFVLRPDGKWEVLLTQADTNRFYKEGEPVRYPKRKVNQEQNWYHLPLYQASYKLAKAYVAWLDRSNRLPGAAVCDEYQWERAGKGADTRAYPHGERMDPKDANYNLTYDFDQDQLGPDEVEIHPESNSIFGIADLAGNISEFISVGHNKNRAFYRSGTCGVGPAPARVDYRGDSISEDLAPPITGFRVCAPYPLPRPFSSGNSRP